MIATLSHRRSLLTAAIAMCSAATLTLAGCTDNDNQQSAGGTTTVTVEQSDARGEGSSAGESKADKSADESNKKDEKKPDSFFSGEPSPANPPASPDKPKQSPSSGGQGAGKQIMDQLAAGLKNGDKLQIGNVSATACVVGDGWGTHVWAGAPNTSCDFVKAVGDELTRGVNATTENVRLTLPRTVNVKSPTTGQTYEMACTVDGDKLITCRGGNNAGVYMY